MARDRLPELIGSEVIRLLREERLRQAISMNSMAQRTGLSQSTISLIERELRNPTLESVIRISEVLELDLGRILSKARQKVIAASGQILG